MKGNLSLWNIWYLSKEFVVNFLSVFEWSKFVLGLCLYIEIRQRQSYGWRLFSRKYSSDKAYFKSFQMFARTTACFIGYSLVYSMEHNAVEWYYYYFIKSFVEEPVFCYSFKYTVTVPLQFEKIFFKFGNRITHYNGKSGSHTFKLTIRSTRRLLMFMF